MEVGLKSMKAWWIYSDGNESEAYKRWRQGPNAKDVAE